MSTLNGRPAFIMSEQTAALVGALRGVNRDISYTALSRTVGFAVSGSSPQLASARKHLESRESIVFETIRGEGVRRLDDTGKIGSTAKHARTIGRTARRGRKRLRTVENFAALPQKEQLAATLRATQFEFAEQAVSSKKIENPAAAVDSSGSDLKQLLKRVANAL